ncbi:EamA family transporter RarD [Moraxella nasovis]|uniref:EamA family transporter RarD n=1 Tax=Moraxella nasovis TaxID=2904121 RepID=UPI001F60812F|nr:EamA family transporter RarD [Moraxella nasovis]UNU72601.1 EamA family transporter RarD [Moraxella nasovis]
MSVLKQFSKKSPIKPHIKDSPLFMGVFLALLSNVLFGVLYVYGKWVAILSGTSVFLWRLVMMWVCMTLFLILTRQMTVVATDIGAIKGLKSWLWLLIPTPIFASQLWLFMWAPLNGHGVATAMGYFLFPLVMVLFGAALFKERLSRLQWCAVALAAVGVTLEIIRTGSISWATFWVCGTYPIYYIMRRRQGIRALTGLYFDTCIIAPVCLLWLLMNDWQGVRMVLFDGWILVKIFGLGALSVLALQSNLEANHRLPVSLFGMLGYLEPALLFVLAVTVLGGEFDMDMLASYGLIWMGILCLIIQGVLVSRRRSY